MKLEVYMVRYNKPPFKRSFVGVDHASGGHPFPTDFRQGHIFHTREQAEHYTKLFPDLEVAEVTCYIKDME